jgi:soluble lytic murein transglycosylase-like protein
MFLAANLVSCGTLVVAPSAPPAVSAPPAAAVTQEAVEFERLEDPIAQEIRDLIARYRTGLAPHELTVLAKTIAEESRRHDLDASLVLAVMRVESLFNTYAVSPVGAIGLMQVMPRTGAAVAIEEGITWPGPHVLFDPVVNVRIGVAYLKHLTDRYGDVSAALAAYNWGPTHIDSRIRRGTRLPVEYPTLVKNAHLIVQLASSN